MEQKVKEIIDKHVRELWVREIRDDYFANRILKEDSLKNAMYHHLRNRLGDAFLDEHQLQIYTEFNDGPLKGTGKRADIAIIKLKDSVYGDNECTGYLGDLVEEVVAIFELKYKGSYSAIKDIQGDVEKLRSYIEDDKLKCMYYLAAMHDLEWEDDHYITDDGNMAWAANQVIELVGSYDSQLDEFAFKVYAH